MTTIRYFAYGSNMLSSRLRARCPSAQPIGPAQVASHRLVFSKPSQDGSGKATLAPATGSEFSIFGVMFEIDRRDMTALDKAEERGTGYNRLDQFAVRCLTRQENLHNTTYIACNPVDNLKPYDWYLALVIAGAQENGLDDTYIRDLLETPRTPDPQPDRPGRCAALKALNEAGYADEMDVLTGAKIRR